MGRGSIAHAAAAVVLGWSGTACGQAAPPKPASTPWEAITGGKLLLEVRGRYEFVDQKKTATLTEDGEAWTVRTRLGWETAEWRGLRALIEVEDVSPLGPERYAVNVPGAPPPPLNGADKARYPLINDPEVTELNRLQLTWKPGLDLTLTAGRQRILIDDQRFVGNVGWRQDEQTFDALRADASLGKVKGTYAYVTRVNRVLGEDRDWDSDSHLLTLAWSPSDRLRLRLQAFAYALSFENSRANSSLTTGVKAAGKVQASPAQITWNAAFARQSDWRGATAPYDLSWAAADVTGALGAWSARLGYEQLDGNGLRGFTMPLATTHAFNGWSDAFVQPLGGNKGFVDGLEDLNLTVGFRPKLKLGRLSNLDVLVRYHDFDGQRTGADLGQEWDAQVQASLSPRLSVALKYADFDRETSVPAGAATPPPSRTKVWLTLEYRR